MKKPLGGFYCIDAGKFAFIVAVLVCIAVIFIFAFFPEDEVIKERLRRIYSKNPFVDVPSPLGIKIAISIVIVLIGVLCIIQLKEEKK